MCIRMMYKKYTKRLDKTWQIRFYPVFWHNSNFFANDSILSQNNVSTIKTNSSYLVFYQRDLTRFLFLFFFFTVLIISSTRHLSATTREKIIFFGDSDVYVSIFRPIAFKVHTNKRNLMFDHRNSGSLSVWERALLYHYELETRI